MCRFGDITRTSTKLETTDKRLILESTRNVYKPIRNKNWNHDRKRTKGRQGDVQKRKCNRQTRKEDLLSTWAARGMQFKTATWHHFTPVRVAKIRQLDGAMCWPRCEGRWTSVIFSRYLTVHGQIQRTLTLRFAITCSWISNQTKLSHVSEVLPSRTSIAALSVLAESWGQSETPRYPWEWRIKMWWSWTRKL